MELSFDEFMPLILQINLFLMVSYVPYHMVLFKKGMFSPPLLMFPATRNNSCNAFTLLAILLLRIQHSSVTETMPPEVAQYVCFYHVALS